MTLRLTAHALDRAEELLGRIHRIHSRPGEAFYMWFRRAAEEAYQRIASKRRGVAQASHLGARWRFNVDAEPPTLVTVMLIDRQSLRVKGRRKQLSRGRRPEVVEDPE